MSIIATRSGRSKIQACGTESWPRPDRYRKECCFLPGISTAGWGPDALQLAQEHHAAQMVGVVGGEAFQLVADGHVGWSALRVSGAVDDHFEPLSIVGNRCGVVCSCEKAFAEMLPRLAGAPT